MGKDHEWTTETNICVTMCLQEAFDHLYQHAIHSNRIHAQVRCEQSQTVLLLHAAFSQSG